MFLTITRHKSLQLLLLIVFTLLTGAALLGAWQGIKQEIILAPTAITNENGLAYIAVLPRTSYLLFSVSGDSVHNPQQAKTVLFEDERLLGPAHAVHDAIRTAGQGRFSHWGATLYFSTSDNSDPRTNGRAYKAVVTATSSGLFLGVSLIGLAAALYFNHHFILKSFQAVPGAGWLLKEVLPGILITVVILALLAAGGELYLRTKWPFIQTTWPSRFNEKYGWTLQPGATVNWTNHVDFWASTQANSLGFLDREPPAHPSTDEICRVVFIGDSYVEAAQLPIDQKFHILFEQLANEHLANGKQFETVAFGYSGTGQINQLPFYDVFAQTLHPDVVVLAFVSNDIANNSTVLESVRNGWHPLHPPRLFFEYDEEADAVTSIPIDPAWQQFVLPSLPGENKQPKVAAWLESHSYLYNWLYAGFLRNSQIAAVQQFAAWLKGAPPVADIYRHRRHEVEKLAAFAGVFADWPEENMNLDNPAQTGSFPPVFEEAILLTGHAFDEFLERSQGDGFHLLALITDSVALYGKSQYPRITELLAEREIPYQELRPTAKLA